MRPFNLGVSGLLAVACLLFAFEPAAAQFGDEMTPTTVIPVGTRVHATIPTRGAANLLATTAIPAVISVRAATSKAGTAIPVPAGADSALAADLDRPEAVSVLRAAVSVRQAALAVGSVLLVALAVDSVLLEAVSRIRGGGDDAGSRTAGFFDRLDRNGDGRLDGDEMSGAGPFQGFLDRAGIKEGSTREDFTKGFERAREEMQGRRESGDDDRDRSDGRGRSSSQSGYTPAKRERVTLDLPESFADRDGDRDGQIGLYEWREWDRTRVDEFFFIDRNGDGFLTPSELAAVEGGNEDDGERDRSDRGRSREPERRQEPRPQPPHAVAAASTPVAATLDESDANVRQGRMYFSVLDANRDGRASVEELGKLNKLRPLFEEAGVRLDQEMTADEFTANYAKAAKPQQ